MMILGWRDNVDNDHIMPSNGYSVNMNPPVRKDQTARPYHHGDLRQALIDAGLRLIETRAEDDLGLRELAREVGVSPTAIYRHFPDKQALKAALAGAGLVRLAVSQQQASAKAGGGAACFLASGMAYVRFAAGQPVLFRLIFSHAAVDDLLDADPSRQSTAMRGLRDDVDRLVPPGCPAAERKALALHAWALVHGLARLVLDQQIPPDWALIERVLAGMVTLLGNGRTAPG